MYFLLVESLTGLSKVKVAWVKSYVAELGRAYTLNKSGGEGRKVRSRPVGPSRVILHLYELVMRPVRTLSCYRTPHTATNTSNLDLGFFNLLTVYIFKKSVCS